MRVRLPARPRRFSGIYWLAVGFLIVVFIVFYLLRLSSLTYHRISPAESAARSNTHSVSALLTNPLDIPQKALQLSVQELGFHSAFSLRLASVIMAFLLLLALFWLLRTWFGTVAGLAAALMFMTTPVVVLLGRSATGDVMLLAPAWLLAGFVFLSRRTRTATWPWLVMVTIVCLSLYSPGLIWLILAAGIFMHRRLASIVKSLSPALLAASALWVILLLLPLIWALIKHPQLYHQFLLLPAHWPTPLAALKDIAWAALSLVWRAPYHSDLILNRLPLLSGVQICLIVFGSFVMWTRARRQMVCIIVLAIFGILAAGLNHNPLLVVMALPGSAILVAAGLRYLMVEWRSIFPKNPLPVGLAWALVIAVVGLQMVYGLRYSLIAWPHSADTKQLYKLK